jgi:pyruvate dehydrogenase E2 component (dihydrolipoamide acetyltransferase)
VTRLHVKAGDEIRTGAPIVSVEPIPDGSQEDAGPEEPPQPRTEAPPAAPVEPGPTTGATAAPVASPSIRLMARQLGIDLGRVRGTGRGGRIVLGDLRDYISALERSARPTEAATEGRVPPPRSIDFSKWGPVTPVRLTSLRKTIARRMVESWTQAPHVTQSGEADITGLTELRRRHAPAYKAGDARLTLTPILLKATASALARHPSLNSSLDEAAGAIVNKNYYHLGLAVDTDAGLIVPVVRDVDRKTVYELAREIEELAGRTRRREISREEMQGGTFTVSNQGGIGGGHFTPIINLPEVAILGVGRGREAVALKEGTPVSRLMLPLTVSHDHRVVDGAAGVRFLVDLIETLESFPESELKLNE